MAVSSSSPRLANARIGTLILIVGPSGSGKDTLLDAARTHFRDNETLLFCQRVITRTDQVAERHIIVSEDEFERRKHKGGFFLSWHAHELHYGIGKEILGTLEAGRSVVANVSRQIVEEAREKWPNTHVIHVTARKDVLRERLIARARESLDGINERIARSDSFGSLDADWLSRLDNSGTLAEGVECFVALIAQAIRCETDSAR